MSSPSEKVRANEFTSPVGLMELEEVLSPRRLDFLNRIFFLRE